MFQGVPTPYPRMMLPNPARLCYDSGMEQDVFSGQEEQLAAQRFLAISEEELQRIILDVHDGPVQQLFAARSQLSALQNRRARGESIPEADYDQAVGRLVRLIDGALAEIRSFLGAFRPPDFSHRDLIEILQDLFVYHEDTTGCQVCYSGPEGLPTAVSLPIKIALYRICQEALSNAYRHSGARQQWVRVAHSPGELMLAIRDEGRGFTPPPLSGPSATQREEHIGLRGMRDRVALVGGVFDLRSSPQQGTHITVRVPLYD